MFVIFSLDFQRLNRLDLQIANKGLVRRNLFAIFYNLLTVNYFKRITQ